MMGTRIHILKQVQDFILDKKVEVRQVHLQKSVTFIQCEFNRSLLSSEVYSEKKSTSGGDKE